MLLEIIRGLFSLGMNLFSLFFQLMIALVIGFSMSAKGRNGLLWGVAGFFFPWLILVIYFVPPKMPKLNPVIRNHPDFQGKNPIIAAIMALSATVAKADGHVSREEIQLIRNFIQRQFRISAEELNGYAGAFNYGKDHPEDYEHFTALLRQYRRYNIVMAVSYLFVGLAMQGGEIKAEEETVLRRIITDLGLHEYEYQSIKQHYSGNAYGGFGYRQSTGNRQYYRQSYHQAGPSNSDLKKKYSEVLGVSEDADMTTIKKAYRKLAKEHHPDRMAQDGMPEGYIQYANQRISEINEAYEWLKNAEAATA